MKRIRLNILSILLLSLSLFALSNDAKACHCAAADMWVVYNGPGIDGCTGTTVYSYDVYLAWYEACQTCSGNPGVSPSGTASVFSPTLGTGSTQTITLNDPTAAPNSDLIYSLCPKFDDSNSCKHINQEPYISQYPAFRRRIYKSPTSIILPSAQTDWTFSFTTGARNQSINMPSCTFGTFYIETLINNVNQYNTSSARFTSNPLPYICANQPNTYLNSPFNPNGDSMVIFQNAPSQGPAAPCVFPGAGATPPATLQAPIVSASSNPYTLNPVTGAVTFTPIQAGPYLVSFKAITYERGSGTILSTTVRDALVNVVPCNTPPPAIDSLQSVQGIIEGSSVPVLDNDGKRSGYAIVTCPGNNLKFSVNSQTTPGRNLFMYADTGKLVNSTFSIANDGTDNVTGTVGWTPTTADIGEHTLTIKSADSTCTLSQPIVVYNYTVIYIKVTNGLDAGKDQPTCDLNPPRRQLFVKGFGNLELKVKWSDVNGGPAMGIDNDTIFNPTVAGPGGTQYVVSSSDLKGQCKSRDTLMLINDTNNTVDIFPHTDRYVLCRPGYLQLDAATTGGGPVDNIKCDTLPVFTCPKPDSIVLFGSAAFGNGIAYDTAGTAATIFNGDVLTERFQFLINKEELKEYGLRSGTIKSLSFEVDKNTTNPPHEYANFKIYMKCTDKRSLSKGNGFENDLILVYSAPANITLENGWHNFVFDKPYNWDTTKNIVIGMCYGDNPGTLGPCTPGGAGFPGVLKYVPTTYISTLDLKRDPTGSTNVCNDNTLSDMRERSTRPIFSLTYCDAPGKPFIYTWYPGTLLSDSTIKAPLTYASTTTNYQVSTLGKNGCKIVDTMQVYIPVHDFRVFPDDTSICYGQTTPLEIKKGTYYQWFEYEEGKYLSANNSLSCEYCPNPTAKPQKSTRYRIMVGDDVFCYDTIDAYVEVRPLPLVNILTKDTIIKFGQSVQLLVNGGKLYNWSPVSSLNNPNISYPIATPTEPTMYVVSGINSTGCYSYDTVRVGISYRDNLQIPTAFTPNGDGKNDQFRVNNMTFQRFVEFRVFNRWGQEVYQGGDPKSGWDGNWKGVPQEMGNYQYIIRVGSPDGLVETYKGDVTLLR